MKKVIALACLFLVNTAAFADGSAIGLGGYCPVAYAKAGKAVFGNPKFASDYKGRTYYFVSADAKKMFDASPSSYEVKYDSWCATGLAMGKKIASKPEFFLSKDGAIYLFSSIEAKDAFQKNFDKMKKDADDFWNKSL